MAHKQKCKCKSCGRVLGAIVNDILTTKEFTSTDYGWEMNPWSGMNPAMTTYISPGKIQMYEKGPDLICQSCTKRPEIHEHI